MRPPGALAKAEGHANLSKGGDPVRLQMPVHQHRDADRFPEEVRRDGRVHHRPDRALLPVRPLYRTVLQPLCLPLALVPLGVGRDAAVGRVEAAFEDDLDPGRADPLGVYAKQEIAVAHHSPASRTAASKRSISVASSEGASRAARTAGAFSMTSGSTLTLR